MQEHERHAMELVQTYPSGAEEWHCPQCGRRFVIQWPPAYKRIVLEPGDEQVQHAATKGGLQFTGFQASSTSEGAESTAPEVIKPAESAAPAANEDLSVWLASIEQLKFDDEDGDAPGDDTAHA